MEFLSFITLWVFKFHHNLSFWVSSQFRFFCENRFFVKEKVCFRRRKKFFSKKCFLVTQVFGHYCHYCHYCHNCHYCHYCHYYHIGWKVGRFLWPFDTLKVPFSQRSPTDQQTDQRTIRLLELLWAAKKIWILDLYPMHSHCGTKLRKGSCFFDDRIRVQCTLDSAVQCCEGFGKV